MARPVQSRFPMVNQSLRHEVLSETLAAVADISPRGLGANARSHLAMDLAIDTDRRMRLGALLSRRLDVRVPPERLDGAARVTDVVDRILEIYEERGSIVWGGSSA